MLLTKAFCNLGNSSLKKTAWLQISRKEMILAAVYYVDKIKYCSCCLHLLMTTIHVLEAYFLFICTNYLPSSLRGLIKWRLPARKKKTKNAYFDYFSGNKTCVSRKEQYREKHRVFGRWLNLDCPRLWTVKAVARERTWDQGVVYVFSYASAVG